MLLPEERENSGWGPTILSSGTAPGHGVKSPVEPLHTLKIQVQSIGMRRTLRPPRLSLDKLCTSSASNLVLHIEEIGNRPVEPCGPQMITGFGVVQ
jgi:hypothetical protein